MNRLTVLVMAMVMNLKLLRKIEVVKTQNQGRAELIKNFKNLFFLFRRIFYVQLLV